ncbi:hypothetical protein [Flavobacterium branchiophilum]|uniref:hypothetical protein n=1 Tax=Flavobacterium branchiophilum TaxID=55197 RepID=UPI000303C853
MKCKKIIISKYKISKNILHAKLVAPPSGVGGLFVVFTLQNKGSYNKKVVDPIWGTVVFTLQNKGSYNSIIVYINNNGLFLPFKIRAVTTTFKRNIHVPKLCLPFKIRAVTTEEIQLIREEKLCLPFKIRAVTTVAQIMFIDAELFLPFKIRALAP